MLSDVYKKVGNSLELSPKYVQTIYRLYWKGILEHLASLPLNLNLNIEDITKRSISIPFLGKLYLNEYQYKRYINEAKEDLTCI